MEVAVIPVGQYDATPERRFLESCLPRLINDFEAAIKADSDMTGVGSGFVRVRELYDKMEVLNDEK